VLLATAYENGDIAANPAQGLRLNLGGTTPGKVKVMTDEEAAVVIAAMPAEHRPLFTFLLQDRPAHIRGAWACLGAC
jgi:hypothetical protein